MKVSQNDRVLDYLKHHVGLTPITALNKLGVYRLSGRIYDLRQLGYQIITNEKVVKTQYGDEAHVAEYRLVE